MLLNIISFVAEKTRFGHIFLIGLPGAAARFDQIRQAGRIDKAILAIAVNSKGVTAHQCNVVRQAGMPDRVILCEQCILVRQLVVRWHERIIDHRAKLLVLEHDDDDMLEVRNKRLWRQQLGLGKELEWAAVGEWESSVDVAEGTGEGVTVGAGSCVQAANKTRRRTQKAERFTKPP